MNNKNIFAALFDISVEENLEKKFFRITSGILFMFFLILVSGYLIIPKTFSKINISIGPVPLYLTEIFLFLLICLFFLKLIIFKFKIEKISFYYFFVLFFLILIFELAKGIYSYRDTALVLRQSALFYYSLFYFLVFYLFNNKVSVKFIIYSVLAAANIVAVFVLINFFGIASVVFGSFYKYFSGGFYFTLAIAFLLLVNILDLIKKKWIKIIVWIDLSLILTLSIIEYVRAGWIALFLSLVFSFLISKNKKRFLINILIIVLITCAFAAFAFLTNPKVLEDTLTEIKSVGDVIVSTNDDGGNANDGANSNDDITDYTSKANTEWRIITWKAFFKESLKNPFLGFGFGRKFLPEETFALGWSTGLAENWVLPHNYILTFLYTSGFAGLALFLVIIFSIFFKGIRFLMFDKNRDKNTDNMRNSNPGKDVDNNTGNYTDSISGVNTENRRIVAGLLSCSLYILCLGLFGVVLEVPYQGAFLWIFMGFLIYIVTENENKNPVGPS